jgi:RNA polymerase sigma-70 factor (ECF subfamily)
MSPTVSETEFIQHYNDYYEKIFNYILRNVYYREIAEDLTSQTFLKALKYIKETNPDIRNISAWLYKIATNEVLMHHRYKRGKNIISFDAMAEEPVQGEQSGNTESNYSDFIALEQALGRLKPSEKLLVELFIFEHKSYAEIAAIVKEKESSLRSRMCRIVGKLKEFFKE